MELQIKTIGRDFAHRKSVNPDIMKSVAIMANGRVGYFNPRNPTLNLPTALTPTNVL
jgi:hypothetical protein